LVRGALHEAGKRVTGFTNLADEGHKILKKPDLFFCPSGEVRDKVQGSLQAGRSYLRKGGILRAKVERSSAQGRYGRYYAVRKGKEPSPRGPEVKDPRGR